MTGLSARPFGRYVLFKRLGRDVLGSTFRAGLLDSGAVSRVVLLRTFTGTGLDPDPQWSAALRNPHLAEPIEVGSVSGQLYLAYDYPGGTSVAGLRSLPLTVPARLAQAICERTARGLSAALAHSPSSPIFHGVLVPELVWLPPDGGVRVLGLELAAGIRERLEGAPGEAPRSPYWSPELLAGEPARPDDDVYTLGALLFELLTACEPPLSPEAWPDAIDGARLARDGEPLPPAARSLLARSVAARAQRLPDVEAWRREIVAWREAEKKASSTFDLAFFLSTSLAERLAGDASEVERESSYEAPVEPATPPSPPPSQRATILRWARRVGSVAAAAALTLLAIRLYLDVAQGPTLVPPHLTVPPAAAAGPAPGAPESLKLRVLVGVDGRALQIEPLDPRSEGDLLVAAQRAARQARWAPATVDGRPVDHWVELDVEFVP